MRNRKFVTVTLCVMAAVLVLPMVLSIVPTQPRVSSVPVPATNRVDESSQEASPDADVRLDLPGDARQNELDTVIDGFELEKQQSNRLDLPTAIRRYYGLADDAPQAELEAFLDQRFKERQRRLYDLPETASEEELQIAIRRGYGLADDASQAEVDEKSQREFEAMQRRLQGLPETATEEELQIAIRRSYGLADDAPKAELYKAIALRFQEVQRRLFGAD